MTSRAAIILAAGQGTRMKSALPKVLHLVGGRPMVDWSIALAKDVGCEKVVVVTGTGSTVVQKHIVKRVGDNAIAIQDPPLGTGHAVLAAKDALEGFSGHVVILYADTPLITKDAVEALFQNLEKGASVGVLGFEAKDPGAYGRLIVTPDGDLEAIVEAREASPDQLAVQTCNSGVMAAAHVDLFKLLSLVDNDNKKGEYYLTDIVGHARRQGQRCAVVTCPEDNVQGANSKAELASVEHAFQSRRRRDALSRGVMMTDPNSVYFSYDTELSADVSIEPNVVFGPGVSVDAGTVIKAFCHIEGAQIGTNCIIGPFARLRPGTTLLSGVKIGNFVETKNVQLGEGAKANHLSYLGDGRIGPRANIGAGTIFCNYDGFLKYETTIGADAFIGSNSALVAPVAIGDKAIVGSGSVVTEDVAPGALALARARQSEKPGWATAFRERMAAIKAARKKG